MRNRTRKEVAHFVMDAVRSFGIEVNPSSRISKMYRLTTELEATVYPGHRDFEVLLEADRDFQMLEFVFEHLEDAKSDKEFRKLLGFLSYDSALPQLDKANSVGRNTQFHLFASAMCQAGGMKPVTYEEPDLVCTLNLQRIGIAVKRVKSANQAAKRIRDAIVQIHGSALPGVIALDLTVALNPKNEPFDISSNEQDYGELHAAYVNWFLTPLEPRIRQWVAQENVLGLVATYNQPRLDHEGKWELSGITVQMPTAESAEGREVFENFFRSYTSALPNRTDL